MLKMVHFLDPSREGKFNNLLGPPVPGRILHLAISRTFPWRYRHKNLGLQFYSFEGKTEGNSCPAPVLQNAELCLKDFASYIVTKTSSRHPRYFFAYLTYFILM